MKFYLQILKNRTSDVNRQTRVFRFIAPVLFVSAVALSSAAQAQTVVEDMTNGNKTTTKKTTQAGSGSKKKTLPPPKSQNQSVIKTGRRRSGGAAIKNNIEQRQEILITTGAPNVEIWIDGKRIGASDKNAKLRAWLGGGEHQLLARKYEQDLFEPTKISVTAEDIKFDISAEVAKAVDNIKQTTTTPEIAETPAKTEEVKEVDAKAILELYQDPQKNESVTAQDWQAIYEQCRRKMEVGNTENDVEALHSFAQGQLELSMGNKQKALSLFSAATVFLPNSPMMHYGLGKAQIINGANGDATTSFNKALQFDAKYSLAYKELGDIYLAQNKTKEAARYYQAAQKNGMNTSALRLKIAELQIKNKNCQAAMKELEILREEAPSAGVMMALSDCYLEQKRAVSAIEALEKAIELEPNSSTAHYKIGSIYLKQKEYNKAKESLERALALDGDSKSIDRKELKDLIEKAQKRSFN